MTPDELAGKYRKASQRASYVALVIAGAVAVLIGWNTQQLGSVDSKLQQQDSLLYSLEQEYKALTGELTKLTEDPNEGIRSYARKLPTEQLLYDFSIWIITAHLPKGISEVQYEFTSSSYPSATSRLHSNGFAHFLRGKECPGQTTVTISFEDKPQQVIDYDFCAAIEM